MSKCDYTRTVSGKCEQEPVAERFRVSKSRLYKTPCYYHDKVAAGLIEADEAAALNDLPKISNLD